MSELPNPNTERLITLWEQLTEQALHSDSFTFRMNGNHFNLYTANKRIKEAIEVDAASVSLSINSLIKQVAEAEKFTLADIMSEDERLKSKLAIVHELNAYFRAPEVQSLHQQFYDYCEGALAHYRGREPGEEERAFVLESAVFVGLDAYHATDKLTRLMVQDGALSTKDQAKVNHLVLGFDSIEDLISLAHQIPTGFSLCCILRPHVSDSYFVMVVRNGDRIIALTDKGNYTHPLQEARMRQRNDRYNHERIDRSHFPYDLLNLKWSDNGRDSRADAPRNQLATESSLWSLGTLADLNNWDLLWLHMFIDQCIKRYFDDARSEPPIALGSMARIPHSWIGDSNAEQLPVPAQYEVQLDRVPSAQLTTEFMTSLEPGWATKPNPNRWMERRFGAEVPIEALYIPTAAMEISEGRADLIKDADGIKLVPKQAESTPFYRPNVLSLVPTDVTALSTPERVRRDMYFLARYNQAQVIQHLAKEDYSARQAEMQQWCFDAMAANMPNIIDDLIALNHERFWLDREELSGEVELLRSELKGSSGGDSQPVEIPLNQGRGIRLSYIPPRHRFAPDRKTGPSLAKSMGLELYELHSTVCALDQEEEANVCLYLTTDTILDIVNITGLSVSDIPVELHSRGIKTYVGNSILSRIDPMASIKNPWDELRLSFILPLSLSALKKRRREMGLSTPRSGLLESFAEESSAAARQARYRAKLVEGLE
jgi:hypothetical protein